MKRYDWNDRPDNMDELLEKKLKDGLDAFDDNIRVTAPDINHFRQLVTKVEEKKQTRRFGENLAFLAAAVAILGTEAFIFNRSFSVFIAVQVTAIVAIPIFAVFKYKSGRRKVTST